ncbi:MAG: choice-of-anchor J domain-containing protein [Bacteroidales bacterium]|jgi:hypothetical protein|nr:T9SS type A sorting domain-containing protein [Bacteroidales bacterium]
MKKYFLLAVSFLFIIGTQAQFQRGTNNKKHLTNIKKVNYSQIKKTSNKSNRANIFFEGFEEGVMPNDWVVIDGDGDTNAWEIGSLNEEYRVHTGEFCVTSASFDFASFMDLTPSNWLLSPAIELPDEASIKLEYWIGHQDAEFFAEEYRCLISTNGSTDTLDFTEILIEETLELAEYEDNLYSLRTFDLSQYANTTIRIAWHHTGGGALNLNLDDIRIYKGLAIDAELVDLIIPESGCALSSSEEIKIKVKNNGATDISNVTVSYKVNDNDDVEEAIVGPIASEETVEYSFQTLADLSELGTIFSIQAKVSLEDDMDNSNNLSDMIETQNVTPSTAPYENGFEEESDYLGWKIFDNNNDGDTWFFGYSEDGEESHNGTGLIAILGNDENASDDWIISTCLNLSTGDYVLKYWYAAGSDFYPENMKLAYGTSQNPDGMIYELNNHEGFNNEEYEQATVNFTIHSEQVYYIGFHAYSDAGMFIIKLDDISLEKSTGIANNALNTKIYPNPASSKIRIESNSKIDEIRISNILGQEVYSKRSLDFGTEVNVSNFDSGFYFVSIYTDKGVVSKKINIVR